MVLPLFVPAELDSGLWGLEGGKEPSGVKPSPDSTSLIAMCAFYAELIGNSSSQASPNFHAGYRLIFREDLQSLGRCTIANSRHAQPLRDQIYRELVYRRFQFQKRSQDFIGANDETPSVAVCVHNPDCAP
jgi:hypothetical protein